jgi:hypothetical protein
MRIASASKKMKFTVLSVAREGSGSAYDYGGVKHNDDLFTHLGKERLCRSHRLYLFPESTFIGWGCSRLMCKVSACQVPGE